ncbi:MAG: acetate--CoA ligase family protein [Candidatus Bathyarchaeia archaeon]
MLEAFLKPSSVAVIGASREPGKVGHDVTVNILKSGYRGKVFPVNPNAAEVAGLKCYRSVLDIPDIVDLAVVAVPAPLVPGVALESGKKGVKGLVVISAGFREIGPDGLMREARLLETCRRYGMRLLGPNCLGLINTYLPINASFASSMALKGNIAFISQSGALATSVLSWSLTERVGFSTFVSLGNRADLDETDFLEAAVEDPETRVVLVYMEGVGDGRKFMRVVPSLTKRKPIIVVKSGTSNAGARAISSHTGSLAGSDLIYETAFKQAGVIRVTSTEQLFDLAEAFSTQPVPEGPNVAVVTNAGGPGILATDALDRYGATLAPIGPELGAALRAKLPPAAGYHNPVDVLGDARADRYRYALQTLLSSTDVHAAMVILTPQAMTEPTETAKAIVELKRLFPGKPLVTAFLGGNELTGAVEVLKEAGVPNYPFPERAAYALSRLIAYRKLLESSPPEGADRFEVDQGFVKQYLDMVRLEGRVNLTGAEAMAILKAYGVPGVECRLARDPTEAVKLADAMGYPIVVKVSSPQILHKTDVGGVRLGLVSAKDVAEGFESVVSNARRLLPQASIYGAEVCQMAPQGREIIVGAHRDPQFGPVIMFGLGGIYVNFLRDVAFRLPPITRKEALAMIAETHAYALLRGIRGEPPSDIDSVVDVLCRVSQLVLDFPEVVELDVNPLFVYERGKGSLAVDAKITIAP